MDLGFSVFTDFIAAHRGWTVPLVFLVSFAESFAFVSLLVPGTTILAACGALIPSGTLSAWALLAGAIPGAVIGDTISYWLGARYGTRLTAMWPLRQHPAMVTKGEAFMQRHGVWGVAIGRFFGPVRAVIPLLAGMSHMPQLPFTLANIGSAIVWAPAILFPGAVFGWAVESADGFELAIAGGLILAVALAFLARRLWRARTTPP
jgi:membrane protein DedA with SNARE-associated domain